MKKIIFFIAFLLGMSAVNGGLIEKEIEYKAGDLNMKGFLVYNEGTEGQSPGILIVHEWWGHNEYVRKRARMLAELGYVALAVDMFGDGKTADHPDDAGKFAGEVMKNMEGAKERFDAAYKVLVKHPMVDDSKIAAIGYCFGGGVVLQMARLGADLKGVVSFHGSIATSLPAERGKVKAAVLVCNGAEDVLVTKEQIDDFKKEMEDAGVDYKFVNYDGAKHSFTNPDADMFAEKFGMPVSYDKKADAESWQEMRIFLKKIFNG